MTLAARTAVELDETARDVAGTYGSDVLTAITDVTSREQVDEAVTRTLDRYGRIDVMVNNAGNIGPVGKLWDNDPEDWARTVSVHLLGVFYGCRAVVPVMLNQDSGRIVNMSGVGGPQYVLIRCRKVGNRQFD